jgi:hypothetical protein
VRHFWTSWALLFGIPTAVLIGWILILRFLAKRELDPQESKPQPYKIKHPLLGCQVEVTLARKADGQTAVAKVGRLMWVDSEGAAGVSDGDGEEWYCWPVLSITAR